MKCVIPGPNVKGKGEFVSQHTYFRMLIVTWLENTCFHLFCMLVLARAVHALCRIGDELYVEPEPTRLSFRAVSASKSAYASFTFTESFFSHYNFEETKSQEDVTCKVSMKVCGFLYWYIGQYFIVFLR
jgi:hypothetical protein